ncbi:MAG: protein kinase, partial [Phycisphaerae bacterium]
MTHPRKEDIAGIANIARRMAPAARAAYLEGVGAEDAALRREVEQLLRGAAAPAASTDTTVQATQAPTQPAVAGPSGAAPPPLRINAYRILEVLGEGSMGVVYRAEQQNPHRDVALKVLKPGGATDAALKRFEQEAQMLGRLQHPGIAQIFEAGTSDSGYGPQPFFAMELIHGLPLNEYAGAHALDIRARLELLVKVCDGVEHAHQKGVIHRDLKPGNILVDQSGQPKILDFGIALAIDQTADESASSSEYESLTGTIPYMSFEQVTGKPSEVDTRSDVYALGVIGYQLLSGCLPHDLSHKSIPDAIRIISQDPPRPLGQISKAFRGDLELIITKALEREKSSRYPTASALADDLRRYLSDEPILARPPSSVYVFKKFAQRNKAFVGGVAAILFTLVAGLVTSTAFYLKAKERATRALQAVQRSQVTADTLFEVFLRSANPQATANRVTVWDALDQVAARIQDGTRRIEPEHEAAVHLTLGKSYRVAGLAKRAEPHLVRALQIDQHDLGEEDPQTLEDMNELGLLYKESGRYADAQSLYRTSLKVRQRVLGPEDRKTLETQHNLAQLMDQMGQTAAAEKVYRDLLKIQRRVLPEEDALTLSTTNA